MENKFKTKNRCKTHLHHCFNNKLEGNKKPQLDLPVMSDLSSLKNCLFQLNLFLGIRPNLPNFIFVLILIVYLVAFLEWKLWGYGRSSYLVGRKRDCLGEIPLVSVAIVTCNWINHEITSYGTVKCVWELLDGRWCNIYPQSMYYVRYRNREESGLSYRVLSPMWDSLGLSCDLQDAVVVVAALTLISQCYNNSIVGLQLQNITIIAQIDHGTFSSENNHLFSSKYTNLHNGIRKDTEEIFSFVVANVVEQSSNKEFQGEAPTLNTLWNKMIKIKN